jgi:3',5'-cyclic AMP phosphodiesterase CpdA
MVHIMIMRQRMFWCATTTVALLCAAPGFPVATAAGEQFRFVVVGDTQPLDRRNQYPRVTGMIFDEINALNPDLVLHVGDIVFGTPYENELKEQLNGFRKVASVLKAPLHIAFGNHEMCSMGASQVLSDMFGYLYTSFDYKGAHFVLLNSFLPDSLGSIEGRQLRWLEEDLAANISKKPIFVFIHQPVFPPVQMRDNIRRDRQSLYHSLFLKYGVDAVFSGHQHTYALEYRDGIAYYTTGGGGGHYALSLGSIFTTSCLQTWTMAVCASI